MHLAAIKETHYKENLESHFKNKAVKITKLNCETEEVRETKNGKCFHDMEANIIDCDNSHWTETTKEIVIKGHDLTVGFILG